MNHKAVVLLLSILTSVCSRGQYLDFLKAEHEWPAELRVPLEVKDEFRDEKAVILYENLQLVQNFKKLQFQEFVVEKHKLIFFRDPELTNGGVEITLPEPEDELADISHLPLEKRGAKATPELLDVELHYYAARIYKSDGRVIEIRPVFTFDKRKVKRGDRIVNEFRYSFKHGDVEPGDILEVHYKYEVPYQKNSRWFNTFRVLRNDRVARQIFDVSFRYENGLYHSISGASPSSIDSSDQYVTHRWNFRNVPSIEKVGWDIRSMEEPIILGLNTYADWMYNRRSTPGFRDNIPWYMSTMQRDYSDVSWLYRIATKRISLDKQSRLVKKYLDQTVSEIPDSMPCLKALRIHEEIRSNFEWRADDDWFRGANNELTKMGSQVEGKYLLDRSRRSVYTRLFFQCNAPVLYVRPLDKRVGSMKEGYLGRLWKTPTMFALPQNGRVHYALPKSEYQNLYADEIPFYWENTAAFLINPFQLFAREEMPVRYVVLPGSTENDNRRKVDMEVQVDEDGNAMVLMRVHLSGQFSTIMRPVFQGGVIDSSLSRVYSRLPLEGRPGVKLINKREVSSESKFPFRHVYELEFSIPKLVEESNGSKRLRLELLFPEIPTRIEVNRDVFRPDFRFTDQVNILVKSDKERLVATTKEKLERTFGRSGWTFSCLNQGHTAILISSKTILGSEAFRGEELLQLRELITLYSEKAFQHIPLNHTTP